MAEAGVVEFVIQGSTLDGKPFRQQIEPMPYRLLFNFAKDNELQVRDGRVAQRTRLAEMQRVGDTA